jgi:flagellar biosynthesis protein FlhA
VRKKLSQELGFLVPAVHIRDNLDLAPNAYRITLNGVAVGEAEVYPEREMAINPGRVYGTLPGIATRDPAFGLEALWLERGGREQAQTLGYTVVDASTVVATHLSHLIKTHAHELLTREDVQQLLNNLAKTAPKLVEDLVPKTLSPAIVHKVLQNLLEERVPIRDTRMIAETLAVQAVKSQDPAALTAAVRATLGRAILQQINGTAPDLPVVSLDPALEQLLQQSLQMAGEGGAGLEPGLIEKMRQALQELAQRQTAAGQPVVLLSSPALRPWLARFARQAVPEAHVLAYSEVPDNKQVRIVATIGG